VDRAELRHGSAATLGAVRRPEAMDQPHAGPGPEHGGRIVGAAGPASSGDDVERAKWPNGAGYAWSPGRGGFGGGSARGAGRL
jgi:hypothetical protein